MHSYIQCEQLLAYIMGKSSWLLPSVPPHAGSCCRLGLVNIPLLLPRLCFIRRPFSICGGCFVFAAVFDGAGQPKHWQ